jgi:hypothetical protein
MKTPLHALLLLAALPACMPASANDAWVYDPGFGVGGIVGDYFGAATINDHHEAQRLVRLDNGDLVVAGLVPAIGQPNSNDNFYNIGIARYAANGSPVAWSNPIGAYSSGDGRYLDYPNTNVARFFAIRDLKVVANHLYVYADHYPSATTGDAVIAVFRLDGQFVGSYGAFTTGLAETGAGLAPYTYTIDAGGVPQRVDKLIAVATYTSGGGRRIVTLKRFDFNADGSLVVDTAFGHIGNGAIDQSMPDDRCDAPPCSAIARAVFALRADTPAPTVYIAGDAPNSGSDVNPFVMAIDGSSGDLAGGFGGGSGIYLQYGDLPDGNRADHADALFATTGGDPASDLVYLAADYARSCGSSAAITKLRAQVILPGGPRTLPDFSWANGGTLTFGGDASAICTNGLTVTRPNALALDGAQFAIVGADALLNVITPARGPMLAIVRASDGALLEFARHPAPHAGGGVWGDSTLDDLVVAGAARYVATGTIMDAASSTLGTLFGTVRFAPDRIFGDGFD